MRGYLLNEPYRWIAYMNTFRFLRTICNTVVKRNPMLTFSRLFSSLVFILYSLLQVYIP